MTDIKNRILIGDCRHILPTLPAESVHTVVTSPPYYAKRNYGHPDQIGLEPTPEQYIETLVAVFREVKRVLRKDGTMWINIGDSYAGNGAAYSDSKSTLMGAKESSRMGAARIKKTGGKPKDLIGIPWMLAFALKADGWYLRQDIIWSKTTLKPESVTDRCTNSHEYIFLLSKSPRYYFDADAIAEPIAESTAKDKRLTKADYQAPRNGRNYPGNADKGSGLLKPKNGMRNKRSVWTVAPAPYFGEHTAVFPPKLIEPCILAGCPEGGTVLDPFAGTGTTAKVANQHRRNSILIEINDERKQQNRRIEGTQIRMI